MDKNDSIVISAVVEGDVDEAAARRLIRLAGAAPEMFMVRKESPQFTGT